MKKIWNIISISFVIMFFALSVYFHTNIWIDLGIIALVGFGVYLVLYGFVKLMEKTHSNE